MKKFKFRNLNVKVCYGIAGGLVAILLMCISVKISDKIIFDFRHLTILVVAIFGGFCSALITGGIIFIFRLFYLGVSIDSIVAASNIFIIAIGCGLISKLEIRRWVKWSYMNIVAFIMISISFFTLIQDKDIALNTILIFYISSIIVGTIVYFVTSNILLNDKLYRKYKHEAEYDFLTGLKNIMTFNYTIENIEDILDVSCKNVSVLFIDIDFFKKINDTFGHEIGDKVLEEFGKTLNDLFKTSDMIFRVGGEEFVVILPNCKHKKAMEIAERVRTVYENHTLSFEDDIQVKFTVSIGVASFPETIDSLKSLVSKADRALYKAKENGRNRVEV
jgi:diguanylate cyclase